MANNQHTKGSGKNFDLSSPHQLLEEFEKEGLLKEGSSHQRYLQWIWTSVMGETLRHQSPLCVQLSLQHPAKFVYQIFVFPSPCQLLSSLLKSQIPVPNILFCFPLKMVFKVKTGHFHELLNSPGCLPCIHVIKFDFLLLIVLMLM